MSAKYVLMFGLPGSGKGTLGSKLCAEFPIRHISCGDVFRYHVNAGTEFGKIAKAYIDKGQLTPDAATSEMFLNHLRQQPDVGFYLLEGFPRSIEQSRAFNEDSAQLNRQIIAGVLLEAPINTLVKRLTYRRICPVCKRIYNLETAPPRDGIRCNDDGQILTQRADDQGAVVLSRLELYARTEAPVIDLYDSIIPVTRIQAAHTIDAVFAEAKTVLANFL